MSDRDQTRECPLDQLQPELLKLASPYISRTDSILMCLENKSHRDIGGLLWRDIRTDYSAAIITQSRVIDVARIYDSLFKKYKHYASSLQLVDIAVVQEGQQGSYAYMQLSGRGGAEMKVSFCSLEMCSKFAGVLQAAVEQAKAKTSRPSSASPSNVEERIRTLKGLRQDGTITEAQFQQKLQEIVNQL